MSVTTEDVAEWVKAAWNADTTLSDATTGLVESLIMGRVHDAPTMPYTSFKVTDGDIQRNASPGYLQTFTVEFRTWADTEALGAIKAAIEAALVVRTRTTVTLPSTRVVAILYCLKQPGGLDEDDATRQGQSVKIGTDKYEIFCQG